MGDTTTTPSSAAVSAAAAALEVHTPEPEEDKGPITELPLEGWPGRGLPLQVGSGLKRRGISDGAGLISPGRWAPEDRR